MIKNRNYSLDLLRVIACYLVIQQHASEFYYIGEGGTVVTGSNTFWIGIITTLCRSSVPLFVMLSGFLLLPMQDKISTFFRKRFTRIVYPFIAWCVLYAGYYVLSRGDSFSQMALNILHIPVNFGCEIGHLWYIYMLIGLYLVTPIISPWLQQASKRELEGYLGLWIITTFLPYIHLVYPEVLGEAFWNDTPLLYYFTGFIGYFILGYYLKRFGYPSAALSWIILKGKNAACKLLSDISIKSYGMYLAHILFLNFYYGLFKSISDAAYVTIPLIAVCTFITVYIFVYLLSYLPKSKYIIG